MSIVGSASDWSTDDFREHIAGELGEYAAVTPAARDAVVNMLSFSPVDVTLPDDVGRVIGDDRPDTLVYCAPAGTADRGAAGAGHQPLRAADALAIEKPFGTDLASAHELNDLLRMRLPAPTIFRVDHFLSSELTRRVSHAALPQPHLRADLNASTSSASTSAGWRASPSRAAPPTTTARGQ